jgi:hypothetical protein
VDYYINHRWSLNRCETGIFVHSGVCFLSPLVWFFLWLPEEVLTLLFLLHHENGDFSILMKDILYKPQPVSGADAVSWV